MMSILSIDRHESRRAAIIAMIAIIISCVPYIYGAISAPEGRVFTGTHHINQGDTYTYLAWMEQAREGHLVFKNLYATENQARVIFHPLFLAGGWMAGILGLPNIIAYHLLRVLTALVFLFIAYCFIAVFFSSKKIRLYTLLLLVSSSGLGWMFNSIIASSDNWMSDAITFLTIYESPLLLFSMSLSLVVLMGIILFHTTGRPGFVHMTGLAFALLVITHFYISLLVGMLAFMTIVYFFIRTDIRQGIAFRKFWILFPYVLISLGYLFFVFSRGNIYDDWLGAMDFRSPPPLVYLYGYGLLVPLTFCGIWQAIKKRQEQMLLLVIWVITCAFLLYQPFLPDLQRKFIEGLHIPVTILSVSGLLFIYQMSPAWIRQRRMIFLSMGIILLSCTNWFVMGLDLRLFSSHRLPYTVPENVMQSLSWLRENKDNNSVLLGSYTYSNLAPGVAGISSFFGHTYQTPHVSDKQKVVEDFYSNPGSEDHKKNLLEENGITDIVYGPLEKGLGYMDVRSLSFLKEVYKNGDLAIYRIER